MILKKPLFPTDRISRILLALRLSVDLTFLNSIFALWNYSVWPTFVYMRFGNSSEPIWRVLMNASLYYSAAEFSIPMIKKIIILVLSFSRFFTLGTLTLNQQQVHVTPTHGLLLMPFISSSAWHIVYHRTGWVETLEIALKCIRWSVGWLSG